MLFVAYNISMKSVLTVAVCDDESQCRKDVIDLLNSYNSDVDFEIYEFSNGKEFMESTKAPFAIAFLDIEMPDMSGIEIAELLNKNNSATLLFFITNRDAFVSVAIRNNAFQFLKKPLKAEDFHIDLSRAVELIKKRSFCMVLEWKGKKFAIRPSEILYVESDNKLVTFHLTNGEMINYTEKLQNIYKKMSLYNFSMCHKSFLINLDAVKKFDGAFVFLNSEVMLPISKKHKAEFKKDYNLFINGMSL